MTIKVPCGERSGCVKVPASKSWAHRMLITAALAAEKSELMCDGISNDISATIKCLNAMGAYITISEAGTVSEAAAQNTGNMVIHVSPIKKIIDHSNERALYAPLLCGESGSTLRFLIPIAGALGINAAFHMEGRLSKRPLGPLIDVLSEHGLSFFQDGDILYCRGQLECGSFDIPGNISSQYVSGLLMALPMLPGSSVLNVTGTVESGDYIEMTVKAVEQAGIRFERNGFCFKIEGNQSFKTSKCLEVEKDWSSAAFPLCMGAFSDNGMTVTGLNMDSVQGDKEIINILKGFGAGVEIKSRSANLQEAQGEIADITVRKGNLKGQIIDASRIPDLVPVISVVAAGAKGKTSIINAGRLRLKESDRLATTTAMLKALGADIEETEDGLVINGSRDEESPMLSGGTAESFNDHRIAMSAAVAAGIATGDVTVMGTECTDKSFPGFWSMLENLKISE